MPGATRLFVVLLSLVVDDVVEAELVDTLGGGDDAEPVTELLLLEVLLGAESQKTQWSAKPQSNISGIIPRNKKTHRYFR
jgi:hypothetical protein